MKALDIEILPADAADIKAIGEHSVHVRFWNRSTARRNQSVLGEAVRQRRHGVQPCCIELERSTHEWTLSRMYCDVRVATSTVLDRHVAARGSMRPAALEHLLPHTFARLVGEIGRVELRNGRHDVLDQLTRHR